MILDFPADAPLIRLHPDDNVAVARAALDPAAAAGLPLDFSVRDRIAQGHKMALTAIAPGEPVVKYGQVIGVASRPIARGEHVHTQNLAMADFALEHAFCAGARPTDFVPEAQRATFLGFPRPDGRAGTRNYLAVISSVNCSATVAKAVAARFAGRRGLDAFPNVDGIIPLTHGGGCAINTEAEGYLYLTRVLAGYAVHPNVGAVLMIGLGCETNQIHLLLKRHGLVEGDALRSLTIQGTGGTRASIAAGVAAVEAMLPALDAVRRVPCPAAHLTLALECGARTDIQASRPTRRSAMPPTSWCATAAQPFWPKRRKSTGPSTC